MAVIFSVRYFKSVWGSVVQCGSVWGSVQELTTSLPPRWGSVDRPSPVPATDTVHMDVRSSTLPIVSFMEVLSLHLPRMSCWHSPNLPYSSTSAVLAFNASLTIPLLVYSGSSFFLYSTAGTISTGARSPWSRGRAGPSMWRSMRRLYVYRWI